MIKNKNIKIKTKVQRIRMQTKNYKLHFHLVNSETV